MKREQKMLVDLPRRRESGVTVTVWMRDPSCSSEGRSEGSSDMMFLVGSG